MKKASIFISMLIVLYSGVSHAEGMKNSDFLGFTEDQRHWWYAGAFESIGHMVFLHNEEKAQCVWRWLPTEPERKKELLRKSFEKYPNHTPTGILIALLKRDCGSLLPSSKN